MMTRRTAAGLCFAFLLLAFAACSESPSEPGGSIGYQTVLKATLPGQAPDLQGREAIQDEATWQAVWADLHTLSPQAAPEIDFRREMVVVVLGPGCNGEVTVSSIEADHGELVVNAQARACGTALCVDADFSVHTIRIPRLNLPVRLNVKGGVGSLC